MFKKALCIFLVFILLLGVLPFGAIAADSGKYIGVPPSVEVESWGMYISNKFGFALQTEPNYKELYPNNPPASVDTLAEKVDWIAQKCRESGATDPWDIALWLHDWLIYNANYDYTYSRYNASGVLMYGSGVCNSYAEAYRLLLNEFGIENRKLSAPQMDHAWNLVKIDGEWCHIDCTWDDPGEGGFEHHGYFGMTDEIIGADHKWTTSQYPACTSIINYYPIRMGSTIVTNKEELLLALCKGVEEKSEMYYIYYAGGESDFPMREIVLDWAENYSWKFGLMGVISQITGSVLTIRIMGYRDPWDKPSDFDAKHSHFYTKRTTEPTCTEPGSISDVCICGDSIELESIPLKDHSWLKANCKLPKTCSVCGLTEGGLGTHIYTSASDTSCDACGEKRDVKLDRPTMDMFRMYDPNSGEHFYTGSIEERENLVAEGWNYEGVGFTFPYTTGAPVYRLYDRHNTFEHLYTMDEAEKDMLLSQGWELEGIAFNSAYDTEVPQYRLHNPNETRGAYHFTASDVERDNLIAAGWEYQGIGFYSCWK